MSLLKTALACVLLAVLAPWASGQAIRPASSKALGQSTSFAGPAPAAKAASAPLPVAGPPIARKAAYNPPESESWGEAWTSDSPDSDASDVDSSEMPQSAEVPPRAWSSSEVPPDVWNSAGVPPDQWNSAGVPPDEWNSGEIPSNAYSGATCAPGAASCPCNCTDGSCSCSDESSAVSSWLGGYRFGGGNMGFTGPWYVSADAFLLHRSNGNANVPLATNLNTGNPALSAQNLSFTSKVGPRVMLGYAWSHTTAFEVSYFGLIDSRTQTSVTGSDNLIFPGTLGLQVENFAGSSSQMTATYNSRLNNAEFNVLRNTGSSSISWLYGFRYLGLNDHLGVISQDFGTSTYGINARNNMFGIQGGGRWMLNFKQLAFETTMKGGVLENATQQSQQFVNSEIPIPTSSLAKGANVSFLGEIGVNAIYRFGEKWALRGGYTLIWVDGLALAPNQVNYSGLAAPLSR